MFQIEPQEERDLICEGLIEETVMEELTTEFRGVAGIRVTSNQVRHPKTCTTFGQRGLEKELSELRPNGYPEGPVNVGTAIAGTLEQRKERTGKDTLTTLLLPFALQCLPWTGPKARGQGSPGDTICKGLP